VWLCIVFSPGGKHRRPTHGEYALTEEAHEHDKLLIKLGYVLNWIRKKNPNVVIVVENPDANLQKMSIMKQICSELHLHKATVHYCQFGRCDKKPTNLWNNVSGRVFVGPRFCWSTLFQICRDQLPSDRYSTTIETTHRILNCIAGSVHSAARKKPARSVCPATLAVARTANITMLLPFHLL
jgi:hypothetical protein